MLREKAGTGIQGHNIVLVGDFNPKIFQPTWFGREELISNSEEESAKIEIIHPEVVSFNLEWLTLKVTRERFIASTTQAPFYDILRDLVLGTFRILKHTPLRMMGINYDFHFSMESEERWHAFGDMLTPKEPWNGILDKPGMGSLTMEQSIRPDGLKGYIRVKLEPSERIHPGVFFNVNDHYQVKDTNKSIGADEIIDILEKNWNSSKERSEKIIESLLNKS